MEDRAGPIIYGANGAFTRVCARGSRGCSSYVHVTAGLCCAIVKKKWREGRVRAEAEVYATAAWPDSAKRLLTVIALWASVFATSSLSSRKSECMRADTSVPQIKWQWVTSPAQLRSGLPTLTHYQKRVWVYSLPRTPNCIPRFPLSPRARVTNR